MNARHATACGAIVASSTAARGLRVVTGENPLKETFEDKPKGDLTRVVTVLVVLVVVHGDSSDERASVSDQART